MNARITSMDIFRREFGSLAISEARRYVSVIAILLFASMRLSVSESVSVIINVMARRGCDSIIVRLG